MPTGVKVCINQSQKYDNNFHFLVSSLSGAVNLQLQRYEKDFTIANFVAPFADIVEMNIFALEMSAKQRVSKDYESEFNNQN